MENAICIGGPQDGKIVKLPPDDYTLEHITKDGKVTISFCVHKDLTTTAAFHMVFAAYGKKGKAK